MQLLTEELKKQFFSKGISFFAIIFIITLAPLFGTSLKPGMILIMGALWLLATWLLSDFEEEITFTEEIWVILYYTKSTWIALLLYLVVAAIHPLTMPFVLFVTFGVLIVADFFDPAHDMEEEDEFDISLIPEGAEEGYIVTTSRFLSEEEALIFFEGIENGEFHMFEVTLEEMQAIKSLINDWWDSWHRNVEDEDLIYEEGCISLISLEESDPEILKLIGLVQSALQVRFDLNRGEWIDLEKDDEE